MLPPRGVSAAHRTRTNFGEGLKFHVLALLRRTLLTRRSPAGLSVIYHHNLTSSFDEFVSLSLSLSLEVFNMKQVIKVNWSTLWSEPAVEGLNWCIWSHWSQFDQRLQTLERCVHLTHLRLTVCQTSYPWIIATLCTTPVVFHSNFTFISRRFGN